MPDPVQADHATTKQATNDSHPDRSGWGVLTTTPVVGAVCALGAAAVLGDLVTTVYGLGIGLREQNPFVLAVLSHYGVAGLVGLKLVAVSWVAIIWHVLGRRYGVAAMGGLALPQGIAVTLNVLTILSAG